MPGLTRRSLMAVVPFAALPTLLTSRRQAAAGVLRRIEGGPGVGDLYPSQDPDDVRAVVGASHAQLDAVTRMVTKRPALAKASWDWGFGDWETALGAASHTGQRAIADLLIQHGARPNLFTFAMFGQVDVVRAICTANPGVQRIPGPHGITLMRHARAGGAESQDVVDYLTQLGDADLSPTNLPLDEAAAAIYLGAYEPAAAPGVMLIVNWNQRQGGITIQRDDRTPRGLLNEGAHLFHPAGGERVEITFDVTDGPAGALNIRDGDLTLSAERV